MRAFLNLMLYAACILAALLAFVWLLPLIGPFLISFAAAAAMEPLVAKLHNRGVSRGCAAGILTTMVLLLLGSGIALGASNGFAALSGFAQRTPELLERLSGVLADGKERLLVLFQAAAPGGRSREVSAALDAVASEIYAIPALLSEKLLTLAAGWAKRSPDLLLGAVTSAIGVYFFSASYRDIMDFLQRQLPPPALSKARRVWTEIRRAAKGYLRVQVFLTVITFGELLAAFWLLRVRNALGTALVTAAIDALPILGAGAVLLPWAVWCLVTGELSRALGLMVTWAVVSSIRNAIQAKLMDSHLGLHPVVSLMTIYIGWKLCGISGMILLPMAAVVIRQMNAAGIIHLYKTA